jgi:V8-like Glu-specific endopeptidase
LKTTRAARVFGIRTTWHSAGTLLEGQYLVTAAHNLYDSWKSKPIRVLVSCKGKNGEVISSVISQQGIDKAREIEHYDYSFSQDYAFIKLDEALNVEEQISPYETLDLSKIDEVEVAGYPGGTLRYGKGSVIKPIQSESTFTYNVPTARGMSGGPVWTGGSLVGVHGFPGGGRQVNSELIKNYVTWKKAHP